MKIIKAFQEKKIDRTNAWEHYRCMIGLEPTREHIVRDKFFIIDDFTDDFDFPEDYTTWMKHWKQFQKIKKNILI